MAKPGAFTENSLSFNPFWEIASAEPPLEWSKWAAVVEMAVFAKDGIEVQNLLGGKFKLVDPPEPFLKQNQKQNREVRNKEKRVGWENRCLKAREKSVLCISVAWDKAEKLFVPLPRHGRPKAGTAKRKRPGLNIQSTTTKMFMLKIFSLQKEFFIILKQKKRNR